MTGIQLGRIFGIRIRVHWLFLVLLAYFLVAEGPGAALMVACVFGCVVLHELGHSLVARHYGVGVRDITLWPIGGVAQLEGRMPSPQAELAIALAGPMVNVVLVTVFLTLAMATGAGRLALGSGVLGSLANFLGTLVTINLALVLFNLLPAFPMDGGRVYRAWLARRVGMLPATERAVRLGRWVAGLMAIAGVLLPHLMLLLIAGFVYVAGTQEQLAVRMQQARAPVLAFDPARGWHYRAGAATHPMGGSNLRAELELILARLFGDR
jgi:Zn-dependent protease